MSEKGIINEKTGSSMSVRDNGQINLSSGKYSQYKLNPNGRVSELSLESKTTTNRRIIETDDIIINNHKLNPDLWQLTDFKQVSLPYTEKAVIGNMTLQAHIMVKAWDQDLGRYMLIRRPARIRLFSPRINVPDINTGLLINDPLRIDEDILALTDKGYQVNAKISDKNSLIGKECVNIHGVQRIQWIAQAEIAEATWAVLQIQEALVGAILTRILLTRQSGLMATTLKLHVQSWAILIKKATSILTQIMVVIVVYASGILQDAGQTSNCSLNLAREIHTMAFCSLTLCITKQKIPDILKKMMLLC